METPESTLIFDERWYLRAYPDVAKGLVDGGMSPLEHFLKHGLEEGRRARSEFDAEWYARCYPVALEETGTSAPDALERHYHEKGQFRGYLPERNADRYCESAGTTSRFGGLWTDKSNAMDIIRGRYELGLIDSRDKQDLEAFIADGYVILPNAVPSSVLDRAEEALEKAFSGKFPSMLFESRSLGEGHLAWAEGVRQYGAKALDIHWYADQIRDAIFCEPIAHFLALIFERPVLASQTLGFYRGSGQPLHQDSAYVAYSQPRQFTASWIALENVHPGAGELEYLVGSHRALPEFLYPGGMKSVSESFRLRFEPKQVMPEIGKHESGIQSGETTFGLKRLKFEAKRGDALIWHADLAHGGTKISSKHTRKSVVTHYCPREIVPLFFEGGKPNAIVRYDSRNYYTTGIYDYGSGDIAGKVSS